jgi:hypothetical protein
MKINKADLEGAIARGWRSSKNKRKDMDMDLVEAIYEQVKDLLETIPVEKCIECKHLSNPDKVYPPRLCKKHTIPVESKEEGIFYICGLCGEKFTSKFITKPLKQPKTKQGCEKCTHKGKNKDGSSLCPDCNCMTKTIKGLCGKCGKPKRLDDWEKDRKEFQKLFYELNNWSSGLLNEVWDWHIKAIKQEKQRTRKAVIEEIEGKLYDNWSDVNGSWKDTHKFLNSLKEGE